MSEEETIQALQYISDSPDQEHGGFHPQTKETAHNAIHVILGLNQKLLASQLRESKLKHALQLFGAATPPEACPPVTAQSAQCSGPEKLL